MIHKALYFQTNCSEGDKIDLRQAKLILKQRPDIILFESPQNKKNPDTIFNHYSSDKKPLKKVNAIIEKLNRNSIKYPYAKSDIAVWQNIKKLWSSGHNIFLYNIDSPADLRREFFKLKFNYPQSRRDWLFWVFLLLRDSCMARNLQWVLKNYSGKKKPRIAVFLQSIHWQHVQFLLNHPSKKQIKKYFFKRFPELNFKTLNQKIKGRSKILYRYWLKLSL